jgi:ketosteroid isomerase-like protein
MRVAPLLLLLIVACSTARPAIDAEHEVRGAERRWLDLYEHRDAEGMETILADDFVITYPDGAVQRKADVVAAMRRGAGKPAPRFVTEETVAHVYGDTVVLTGMVRTIRDGETVDVSRYTDTYVRRGGAWHVAASHLSRPAQVNSPRIAPGAKD